MPTVKDYNKYLDLDSPDPAREREFLIREKRLIKEKRKAMSKKKDRYETTQVTDSE